jgi:hypothetical protein
VTARLIQISEMQVPAVYSGSYSNPNMGKRRHTKPAQLTNYHTIMNTTTFNTIAAVCGHHAGVAAETVANIEVFVNIADSEPTCSINAPLLIERFGTTSLFRIVALSNNSLTIPRNQMVLCLPTDQLWQVSRLRKIKGARSGKKAVQFDVIPSVGTKEGFDKLVITIPFDGNDGLAILYYQALVFAGQEVTRSLGFP